MQLQVEVRQQMFSSIEQWQQSGLTQKVFCEQQSIRYHVFHYWYKRYRMRQSGVQGTAGSFIKLQVAKPSSSGSVEINYPGGIRLIFHEPGRSSISLVFFCIILMMLVVLIFSHVKGFTSNHLKPVLIFIQTVCQICAGFSGNELEKMVKIGIQNNKKPYKSIIYRVYQVPGTGFEPAHPCERCDLNTVRLPISPPGLI